MSEASRVVTNARGGRSSHISASFDVGVSEAIRHLKDSPAHKAVAAIGMKPGLEMDDDDDDKGDDWSRDLLRSRGSEAL